MGLEEIAKKYDPTTPAKDFDYWLIQYDFDSLSKFLIGDKVLELGCGKGVLTEKLSGVCRELIIIEGSKKNINYVRKRIKKDTIKFTHSLWQDFEYSSKDISDIIFSMGLEHLDPEDSIDILKKLKKYLKKDGRLHIIVPNAYSLHRRVAYYMGIIQDVHELSNRDRLYGHKRVYDKNLLFDEVKKCGYKIIHWEGVYLKPLPNQMMMDLNPDVIRGFYNMGSELPDYCTHLYIVCGL